MTTRADLRRVAAERMTFQWDTLENRAKGGQFAKGGGRVPGRVGSDLYAGSARKAEASTGDGITEVSSLAELRAKVVDATYTPGGFDAIADIDYRVKEQAQGRGRFADDDTFEAMQDYIGGGHVSMNNSARLGAPSDQVKDLDRGFTGPPAEALPNGTKIYRGVGNDDLGPTLRPGDRFADDGFVSTTPSSRSALEFADNLGGNFSGGGKELTYNRTIYAITTRSDRPVIAGDDTEMEYILPRGSTFTVTGVSQLTGDLGYVSRVIEVDWDGVE